MENLTGQSIKGYDLQERIGNGGFGVVYRAYQSTVGREVAIKIILPGFASHPDFIRRFETEAQIIARLEHPYITPLFDYWRDPDGAYLVMRWLRGGSLRDALQKQPFDTESAALLLDQMTSALSVAHRNNVIHRDLKPGNILLDEDGNAYLADFGIAKDISIPGNTEMDAIVGSPDYLSPEQARSEPVTPQADIYSLGVVLYEMLTGEHPFPNLSAVERLYKHLSDPLPQITHLPDVTRDNINTVIQKATAKNPAHRYPDALSLASAFREAIQTPTPQNIVEMLTAREQEILQRVIAGQSNRQIAADLVVTVGTVKWYITQIYRKLNVRSRVQAIVRARELNLITNAANGGVSISITGIPTSEFKPENPYKGLRAFQAADSRDFFGREKLIDKLLKRMNEPGEMTRFLAVIGPSGSGKSSLVKAGLIPAIWRGELPGSEKWFVAEMLPGTHPLDELEIALTRVAANQAANLHEHLARDERGLLRASQLILPDDGSEMLIIIDQFEEIFTLVQDEMVRAQFLKLLHTAVSEQRSRVRIVITLRADFYDRPLQYPDFGELVRSRMETVLPLSADGLERAIAKPAEQVGLKFEEGLVASIVAEVNYQAGALPLLQYALTELFERREGRKLTQAAYQQIGGAGGALAKRAEDVYQEFSDEGKDAVQQMFLRLVTLGEGVSDTRRRVTRSELLAITDDVEMMDEVIDTFTEYRLLSLDNDPATRSPTVELAHEAILREWERLRGWLNESRDEIRIQRQLAAAAAEWSETGKDASFLARGSRLEQFERWIASTELASTQGERDYLHASIAERDRREAVEREQQAREKRLERRSLTFLRVLVGVLLLATLGAFGLTSIAVNNANQAQNNFITAERIRLAVQSQNALDQGEDAELPALLAIRSLQLGYSPEADAALLSALSRGFAVQRYIGHSGRVGDAEFSPDGRFVLTASDDNIARLWDAQTGREVRQFIGHSGLVNAATFSPDGQTILTGSGDSTARLWAVQSGQEIRRYVHPPGVVYCAAFSPDGRMVATGGGDRVIHLRDVETGEEVRQFVGHTGEIWWAVFSPDGQYLVTASEDRTARLWDVETGEEVRQFVGHTDGIGGVRFSPDGRYVVTASFDKTARLWDAQTGAEIRQFIGHTEGVFDAVISPDSRYLLTTSFDKTARLWDVQTGQELRQFIGHTAGVGPAAFSADGQMILTGSYDWTARLWSVQGQTEPRQFANLYLNHYGMIYAIRLSPDGHSLLVGTGDGLVRTWDVQTSQMTRQTAFAINLANDVAFSADGRYAVTAHDDGIVRLWDMTTGEELREFNRHTGAIWRVRFSPDDRLIVTASLDGTARLWDVQTGDALHTFVGHEGPVRAAAISSDGRLVVTGSDDNTARIWDAQTGQELMRFVGHSAPVRDAVFSPDGSRIVTGSEDGTARLWNVQTGEELREFIGHTGSISTIAFSPDGKSVLTGSLDQTARQWDVQSGQLIRQFTGHQQEVRFVDFSPDGRFVLTGDLNVAYIWRESLDDLIAYTCANLSRDFSDDERAIYRISDSLPTCTGFANRVSVVEPTWTPFLTSAAPRPTMAPLVIQMVFSTDSVTVSMGAPVQDVYLNVGRGMAMRPVELNPETLEQPVFSTAQGHEPSFFEPPFDIGPFPIGKPLGFTLDQWLEARGKGTYTVLGDRAVLDLQFEKLVPNGLYTLWCAEAKFPPNPHVSEKPCGAPDGSNNSFQGDSNGNGAIRLEIDAFPPSTEQTIYEVAVAYHSDGQTYGKSPGVMGQRTHVQLYYDFHPPTGP